VSATQTRQSRPAARRLPIDELAHTRAPDHARQRVEWDASDRVQADREPAQRVEPESNTADREPPHREPTERGEPHGQPADAQDSERRPPTGKAPAAIPPTATNPIATSPTASHARATPLSSPEAGCGGAAEEVRGSSPGVAGRPREFAACGPPRGHPPTLGAAGFIAIDPTRDISRGALAQRELATSLARGFSARLGIRAGPRGYADACSPSEAPHEAHRARPTVVADLQRGACSRNPGQPGAGSKVRALAKTPHRESSCFHRWSRETFVLEKSLAKD
jgi:YD repeat-containing protein